MGSIFGSPFHGESQVSEGPSINITDSACGGWEQERWVVATAIALTIIISITCLAFLLQRVLRPDVARQSEVVQLPEGTELLLSAVPCNSSLCQHYSSIIASCVGSSHAGSPCSSLSRFVCGDTVCHGRAVDSLVRSYLRALAADALDAWRPRADDLWTAVNRAASLYATCRRVRSASQAIRQDDDNVDVSDAIAETMSILAANESAVDLATRMAARYQDGAIIWLDAAPMRKGESKRRLRLGINSQFLRFAEGMDWLPLHRRRRRSATDAQHSSSTGGAIDDVVKDMLRGNREVVSIWRKAGNLQVQHPVTLPIRNLDEYGLSSKVLMDELNRNTSLATDARYSGNDEIEVVNRAVLPFLEEVLLRTKNLEPYLAWEFVRHRLGCFAPYPRSLAHTEEDSCFDCVEQVAGLAAHAPFLSVSAEVESRAKVTAFMERHVKYALLDHIAKAHWLSANHKELIIERLLFSRIVRGVPACRNGVAKLNAYYADLPPTTGDFWRDFDVAASAAWQRSLRRPALSDAPFPLLSAEPNVFTANDTVYVPAIYLVPPLFSYGEVEAANYGFLGVALVHALLHSIGLTTLPKPPDLEGADVVRHGNALSRCLNLNHASKTSPSPLADVMALGPALSAFTAVVREVSHTRQMYVDACLLTCSGNGPQRCDLSTSQTVKFATAFSCENTSRMAPATRCAVW
ncbi:hypothetical protein HPB49_021280 [Dermacentor silvarum]|uniref:Uncharacterized protein n=1 Tax=Dermacentor silvarum TaxID=543639 RepID=A0ACB8CBD6_DERSI|nr:hypothetical protein HPB49_021280 [Dermacentor silvarum]